MTPPVDVSVALLDVATYTFETGSELRFTPQPFADRYAPSPTGIKSTELDAFEAPTLKPLLDLFRYEAGRLNGSPYFSNS